MMYAPRRNLRQSPTSPDDIGNILVNEGGLMQAFATRSRRMEAASRITREILGDVTAISESDQGHSYEIFPDECSLSTSVPPCDLRSFSESLKPESPSAQNLKKPEVSSPHDAIKQETRQKVKKVNEMRAEQRKAANFGTQPDFQLTEAELTTESLPDKFTSVSLAYILESLANCISKMVTATDVVLITLSKSDKDTTPSTFKPMNILSVQSRYSMICYNMSLQHLKQYEECEKALQDGSAQELSCVREQFLLRKEVLTAQEQKLKLLEEQFQSLKLRVNAIGSCCSMWATTLLGMDTALPIVARLSSPTIRPLSAPRIDSLPLLRTSSMLKNSERYNSARASVVGSFYRRQSVNRVETPVSAHAPVSPAMSEDVECSSLADFGGVDAMEVRVSEFWCNPYVKKAQQCTSRIRRRRKNVFSLDISRNNASPSFMSSDYLPASRPSLCRPLPDGKHSLKDVGGKNNPLHEASGRPATEVRLSQLLRELLRSLGPYMNAPEDVAANNNTATSELREDSSTQPTVPSGSDTVGESTTTQAGGNEMTAAISSAPCIPIRSMITLDGPELTALTESANNLLRFLGMISSAHTTSTPLNVQ